MKKLIMALIASAFLLPATANANEYEVQAMELANNQIKEFIQNPVVVSTLRAQNDAHAELDEAAVIELDKKWRAGDQDTIDPVLNNELSDYLKQVQEQSEGLYTEIFVMDNKGLNVGQSDKTSDYWQGDEDKWQKTYLVGADAIHLSDIEEDESSQTFQMQISVPVVDGDEVIGAATIGVNAELLE